MIENKWFNTGEDQGLFPVQGGGQPSGRQACIESWIECPRSLMLTVWEVALFGLILISSMWVAHLITLSQHTPWQLFLSALPRECQTGLTGRGLYNSPGPYPSTFPFLPIPSSSTFSQHILCPASLHACLPEGLDASLDRKRTLDFNSAKLNIFQSLWRKHFHLSEQKIPLGPLYIPQKECTEPYRIFFS